MRLGAQSIWATRPIVNTPPCEALASHQPVALIVSKNFSVGFENGGKKIQPGATHIWCDWRMEIVRPEEIHLASYTDALKRAIALGTIKIERAQAKLSEIAADSKLFLAKQDDPEALGGDIILPDGTYVPRIPAKTRFLWDGEVCGTINFRWQVGTTELPDYYLGHIGFEVFSWKRDMGYASEALRQILPEAIELEMPFVELVTNIDNLSSQKVIAKNGGMLFERIVQPQAYGGVDGLKFRIYL